MFQILKLILMLDIDELSKYKKQKPNQSKINAPVIHAVFTLSAGETSLWKYLI